MHIALLGDSIFDNWRYVPNERPVVDQLKSLLPNGSKATLLAEDGSVTEMVVSKIELLPKDVTHLVISSGGNDALRAQAKFDLTAGVMNLMTTLVAAQQDFREDYKRLLDTAKRSGKPTLVCTIYDSIPYLEEWQRTLLSIFNDVIVREAFAFGFAVIDLRAVCNEVDDYSAVSPIEPSSKGGMKIAKKIAASVQSVDFKSCGTVLL